MSESDMSTPSTVWGGAAQGAAVWGPVTTSEPCSLEDVMSEELAGQLQEEEEAAQMSHILEDSSRDVDLDALVASQLKDSEINPEIKDDYMLAQMLQHEFDREHDAFLEREEQQWNGSSKVKISYRHYRSLHPAETAVEEEARSQEEAWEEEEKDDPVPHFNKSGISGKGKNIVTKHDANLAGQRNANKVLDQFPPDFDTGDTRKIKMRLPNNVYNKLKRHSLEENKRSHKHREKKDHSTAEMAVDAKTRLILYKLVNSGVLESVEGIVSSGKESVIFHGTGGSMTDALVPSECAIKVFKTTLVAFKNRYEYVRGDMRFVKDAFKKQNPRKIIKIWAEKELANLKKMENCGINCPKAVQLKKHVLLMEFIGKDQKAAPKLRHAKLCAADKELAFSQCVEGMKKMYKDCGLVHADLSPYNMLWHDDMLYFIDLAQGVDIMHPHAMEFLLRDCTNVVKFFSSIGVHGVPSEYELFNEITGHDLKGEGKDFLVQLKQYEKKEGTLHKGVGEEYSFDYFFEQAQKDREAKKKRLAELFDDSDSDDDVPEDIILEEAEKLDPEVEEKLASVLRLEECESTGDGEDQWNSLGSPSVRDEFVGDGEGQENSLGLPSEQGESMEHGGKGQENSLGSPSEQGESMEHGGKGQENSLGSPSGHGAENHS